MAGATRSFKQEPVGGRVSSGAGVLLCWPRCISHVTFPRQRPRTLIFMTALAIIAALVTALCISYHFGVWAVKIAEPFQLLRGSFAQLPFD